LLSGAVPSGMNPEIDPELVYDAMNRRETV
jgi:hypothetical protein